MNNPAKNHFDDRLFMLLGIPLISLIVVIFFLKETPHTVGWSYFLISWAVSALYTVTYWVISRWTIFHWRQKIPGIEKTAKRITTTVLWLIAIVIIFELVCLYFVGWEDLFRNPEKKFENVLRTGPISMILVISVTGIYEAIYFFSMYQRAELEKERLLRSQIEGQLDALRKQVDPHFLFNSLNTLVSIIPENPVAAQEFTVRLSATYRRLLELRHTVNSSLSQELEALDDYLHLLEVRYEGRLQVKQNIDPALADFHLAPLTLQLLVENAVKHNEASLSHPLVVEIFTENQSITVSNKKRLKAKSEIDSTGFGLDNLRNRFHYLNEGKVVIIDSEDTFAVTLPLLEMAPTTSFSTAQKTS